ncbi:SRPBCC family protein [Pseudoxanthomonas mexicana]|uniref:SRPBCC family protein n=1 Tax=Pseudoxanthomonas mexicana TaxID=128785 RepID=A0A7G9T838_PSEMX|nr:SRPBCC family protein [Pseudoxanthomonas mexicana]QLQ29715.1 MAG: SRPBCC family protein [Pseudoxanthomonas sp.]QND80402.1 SRPBCC family protein [Pseudoxanthomonas mexicana]QNN76263.1 SRPBCC family protein [Pseudoxanthomonas mexicana]
MTRLIEFVIALALVLALFLVIGLILPSSRELQESVETNRRMTIVFDTLNNVRRLKDWNPLVPSAANELSYSGGEDNTGVGAKVDFNSANPAWGQGSWEIVESERPAPTGGPGKIVYAINDKRMGTDKRSTFALEPTGKNNRNVKITQSYEVTYGWNLIGRYAGMYVSRHVGDAVKAGLSKLTNMLATVPNFDYRTEGSPLTDLKLVELPAEDLLVVNAGNIDRTNDAIKASIKQNQEWIKRVMEANGLVAAGPVRIITTDYGAEKYAFDVAQPVRKGSAAPKTDAAAEGEAAPAAAPAPVASAGELKVTIPSGAPVEYVRSEPRKLAFASYTGYMAELDNQRNALRAWAVTAGHEVVDRPFESWKSGVDGAFEGDGKFDIYWAVKQ